MPHNFSETPLGSGTAIASQIKEGSLGSIDWFLPNTKVLIHSTFVDSTSNLERAGFFPRLLPSFASSLASASL